MKKDIKVEITNTLIDMLTEHGSDWTKPWVEAGQCVNAGSGKAYRGANVFITGMAMAQKGYTSRHWHTYKGWQKMGHQVAKGEKSTTVFFWKRFDGKKDAITGETKPGGMFAKSYAIFNADQLDGRTFSPVEVALPDGVTPHTVADDMIAATGANISHAPGGAYYVPATDSISLPPVESFTSTDGYYGTAFHELSHWTGHKSRLDRKLTGRFGSPDYAFEELIAECSAAILCVISGVTPEPRADHAKYINNWLKGLRDDPNAAIRAFAQAQKAADFVEQRTFDNDQKAVA